MATNDWCGVLGIERPDLAAVKDHSDANTYARLIVALLERGEQMTLAEVAKRFEEVGIAHYDRALRSLQRCKPGRAPVYRDGDHYSLDPHDDELGLWVFRLGLRPPKAPRIRLVRPEPAALPGEDTPLSVEELDEAWKDASLNSWSAQRLALAVLDAHGGQTMSPPDVVGFVATRTKWHGLRDDSSKFRRKGCPIAVEDNGGWSIATGTADALRAMRKAVRARIETARRHASARPDPSVIAAQRKAAERRRAENARELAAMTRALLVGFPAKAPRAVALLDVGEHSVHTFVDGEFDELRRRVAGYDIVGAEDVRSLLRALDVEADGMRLAELGPPQKSKTLNKRGRTLKITTSLLVQGSCGIGRPFGDPKKLSGYLAKGDLTKLRRRLEADVKSLYALYEYGRLHGAVRLRWGFLDERIPAPWVHRDERMLYDLKKAALERGEAIEVVVGNAPGWSDPWSRARRVDVEQEQSGWRSWLVDEDGYVIDEAEVQKARLAPGV